MYNFSSTLLAPSNWTVTYKSTPCPVLRSPWGRSRGTIYGVQTFQQAVWSAWFPPHIPVTKTSSLSEQAHLLPGWEGHLHPQTYLCPLWVVPQCFLLFWPLPLQGSGLIFIFWWPIVKTSSSFQRNHPPPHTHQSIVIVEISSKPLLPKAPSLELWLWFSSYPMLN